MQNIDTMIDDITSLPADQFNQIPTELENLIQASGQTLSESDLGQVTKSVSAHTLGAGYYLDTGSASAYVLSTIDDFLSAPSLFVGMKVRFIPSNTNNATSVTVQLGSFTAAPLHFGKLENGGTPKVNLSSIKVGDFVDIVYQKTDDENTSYWRVVGTPAQRLEEGIARLPTDSEFVIGEYATDNDFPGSAFTDDRFAVESAKGTSYKLESRLTGMGIEFRSGPYSIGDIDIIKRTVGFFASGYALSADALASGYLIELLFSGRFELEGIPKDCRVLGTKAVVSYTSTSVPDSVLSETFTNLSLINDDASTWKELASIAGVSTSNLTSASVTITSVQVFIDIDPSDVD